ncbi:hypothetical protein ADUPG1_009430, partial [Aduncisulcus paluster]
MEEKEEEREEEEEEEEEEEDGSSSMTDYDICTSDEYDIDRDRMDIIGVNSQRKKPSPSIVPPLTLSKCEKLGISQPGGGVVLSAGGRASSINLHSPTFTERNILNHLRDDAFIELQQEMERKGKEEDGDSSKHKAKGKKEKKKHKKKITLKKRKGGVVKKKKKNNTKKTKGKKTIGKSLKTEKESKNRTSSEQRKLRGFCEFADNDNTVMTITSLEIPDMNGSVSDSQTVTSSSSSSDSSSSSSSPLGVRKQLKVILEEKEQKAKQMEKDTKKFHSSQQILSRVRVERPIYKHTSRLHTHFNNPDDSSIPVDVNENVALKEKLANASDESTTIPPLVACVLWRHGVALIHNNNEVITLDNQWHHVRTYSIGDSTSLEGIDREGVVITAATSDESGTLFVGYADGIVLALAAASGALLWAISTSLVPPAPGEVAPGVVAVHSIVFLGRSVPFPLVIGCPGRPMMMFALPPFSKEPYLLSSHSTDISQLCPVPHATPLFVSVDENGMCCVWNGRFGKSSFAFTLPSAAEIPEQLSSFPFYASNPDTFKVHGKIGPSQSHCSLCPISSSIAVCSFEGKVWGVCVRAGVIMSESIIEYSDGVVCVGSSNNREVCSSRKRTSSNPHDDSLRKDGADSSSFLSQDVRSQHLRDQDRENAIQEDILLSHGKSHVFPEWFIMEDGIDPRKLKMMGKKAGSQLKKVLSMKSSRGSSKSGKPLLSPSLAKKLSVSITDAVRTKPSDDSASSVAAQSHWDALWLVCVHDNGTVRVYKVPKDCVYVKDEFSRRRNSSSTSLQLQHRSISSQGNKEDDRTQGQPLHSPHSHPLSQSHVQGGHSEAGRHSPDPKRSTSPTGPSHQHPRMGSTMPTRPSSASSRHSSLLPFPPPPSPFSNIFPLRVHWTVSVPRLAHDKAGIGSISVFNDFCLLSPKKGRAILLHLAARRVLGVIEEEGLIRSDIAPPPSPTPPPPPSLPSLLDVMREGAMEKVRMMERDVSEEYDKMKGMKLDVTTMGFEYDPPDYLF